MTTDTLLASARETLRIEIAALENLASSIDDNFVDACKRIRNCTGKVVVAGVGKSGHIANKIAATFSSTGTPAFSLHPTEASHGDIGSIQEQDILLAISNSGSNYELMTMMPVIRKKGVAVISITSNPDSALAQASTVHLCTRVTQEACPHNLAPTASTTATLVIGDMLAVALLTDKGFSAQDFAESHPAGRIGKRLLVRIGDIMRSDTLPVISADATIAQGLLEMTSHRLGMVGVVDANGSLIGMFTDGDLRRALREHHTLDSAIDTVMTAAPTTYNIDTLAYDVLEEFEQKKINSAFVVDSNNKPIGAFNFHDLLQSGIV